MKPVLYIVIPCYNEEKVLPITSGMFLEKLKSLISEAVISDDMSEKELIKFVNLEWQAREIIQEKLQILQDYLHQYLNMILRI